MNAAARFTHQGELSRSWAIVVLWSRTQFSTLVLLLAIITSALSIVYVTNATRSMSAGIQQSLLERDHLHVQWSQLLLEKSTWITQARVQHIAEKQLGMVVPRGKSVVIVE